jgi:hypothetical protein
VLTAIAIVAFMVGLALGAACGERIAQPYFAISVFLDGIFTALIAVGAWYHVGRRAEDALVALLITGALMYAVWRRGRIRDEAQ